MRAAIWYAEAAAQGHAQAQYQMGWHHMIGMGTERSSQKAVAYFRQSAEQGNPQAMCCLGVCYMSGDGVEVSVEKAAEWWSKSAEHVSVSKSVQSQCGGLARSSGALCSRLCNTRSSCATVVLAGVCTQFDTPINECVILVDVPWIVRALGTLPGECGGTV